MLIEHIETDLVRIPPARPVSSAGARIASLDYVLVRLHTQSGIEGLGFACLYAGTQAPALKALVEDLADRVRGEDAGFRGRIWRKLWNATTFIGHSGLAMAALCAYDLALWDIAGKAAGAPVYRLIGAIRDHLPVYYSGLFLNYTLDELLAEASQIREQGFRYAKMRVGKPTIAEDVERVKAVQDTLGDGICLMVDCSRGFDAGRAIRLGRRLEELNLYWFEEPTHPDDLEGSARVAAALDTTVASGESAYTKYGVRAMIERDAADLLMLDIQRLGGLTEWLKAAALCEAYNVPVSNHVFHQVTGHGLCTCPGEVVAEYMPWEALFEEQPHVVDGELHMGTAPGLGLTLNREVVTSHRAST